MPATRTATADAPEINALRILALDQVQAARSGHPGLPLGVAPAVYTLFTRHLVVDPADPGWVNRDRCVLSAGHGSAVLYAALHLAGFDLTVDDLRAFRQWGSRTPGHPEVGVVPGVDATTGPLGQGVANAVGMAIAEAMARARLVDGEPLVGHRTFVLASDGDLMEGVALEATALAGHLGLGRLVMLYDDNDVVIDGRASDTHDADAVCASLAAYGWHVSDAVDGEDVEAIDLALRRAVAEADRPSLVRLRTRIGRGSRLEDTPAIHSGSVSADEAAFVRRSLHWDSDVPFDVPDAVRAAWSVVAERGGRERRAWRRRVAQARERGSAAAERLDRWLAPIAEDEVREVLDELAPVGDAEAVRVSGGRVLAALSRRFDNIVGGSADLVAATMAQVPDGGLFSRANPAGRNIAYGLREHAMGAISNGIALHGLFRPFASTFMAFATYEANALRMAALQRLPVVHVLTHDSIAVGEDGPTHQPVEVLATLRATPRTTVVRPADAAEAAVAWATALTTSDGPTVLALSRGPVPQLDRSRSRGDAARGAYVLCAQDAPDLDLVASGAEVASAVAASALLAADGVRAQVVSVPSVGVFVGQPREYRDGVLAPEVPRLFVEAAHPAAWWPLVGDGDAVLGVTRFGASAPPARLLEEYGLTPQHVADAARAVLAARPGGREAGR